jgi:hypothetical protein
VVQKESKMRSSASAPIPQPSLDHRHPFQGVPRRRWAGRAQATLVIRRRQREREGMPG